MEYPHFVYRSAINHAHTYSEDIYFCQKASELGFTIWTDESVKCEHIGTTKFVVNSTIKATNEISKQRILNVFKDLARRNDLPLEHRKYLEDLRYLKKIKPKVIYDIGSCFLNLINFTCYFI